MFDDQFNMVSSNSGTRQVQASPGALQTLAVSAMTIKSTGFIYIYVSNESGQDVYFDNLVVNHTSGPLLEETHYYPFGLVMQGVSDKALKSQYAENKYHFNNGTEPQNKEFSDGSRLELYSTQYRMYDPQIGRFNILDPKPADSVSLYAAFYNNLIRYNDPLGDTTRVYVETSGAGHAWISTGEGDKMTVYS
ncbi:RHS repeat-associated core domain-containing protein [Chitinophaga costaii]|uniref:RHS repeat-associated core domain-containing protein n=1 Tax=Chitinophaga costaii TaxID=1335309 RepID=A0A1C4G8B9_9BACT|nr:RHS repeat-associated core domain-containing protein [Chitinophaga costaii]